MQFKLGIEDSGGNRGNPESATGLDQIGQRFQASHPLRSRELAQAGVDGRDQAVDRGEEFRVLALDAATQVAGFAEEFGPNGDGPYGNLVQHLPVTVSRATRRARAFAVDRMVRGGPFAIRRRLSLR